MLQKIGRTIKKLGQVSQHIYKTIKRELTDQKLTEQKVYLEEVTKPERESQLKPSEALKSSPGELNSSAILAKIGGGVSNENSKTQQSQKNKQYKGKTQANKENTKLSESHNKTNKIIFENYQYTQQDVTSLEIEKLNQQRLNKEMLDIQKELSEALKHWKWTKQVYNHAVGFEQVEYCIYQMMAAEKKYRMTLLKAKQLQVDWSKIKGDMI